MFGRRVLKGVAVQRAACLGPPSMLGPLRSGCTGSDLRFWLLSSLVVRRAEEEELGKASFVGYSC